MSDRPFYHVITAAAFEQNKFLFYIEKKKAKKGRPAFPKFMAYNVPLSPSAKKELSKLSTKFQNKIINFTVSCCFRKLLL